MTLLISFDMIQVMSLKSRVIISFVIVVLITGSIATIVGIHLIGKGIIKQAQEKVRTDLNSAREIYQRELSEIKIIVRLTAERFYVKDALINNDIARLNSEIETVRRREGLDILTLTDPNGRVIVRARNQKMVGDDQSLCPLIQKALKEKDAYASTEIISAEELAKESQELVQKAYLKFIATQKAKPTSLTESTSGMMLKAAAPVVDSNWNLLGVLYGGNLINRNYKIVDKVKETVFEGQNYKGKDIGTATIFQDDLRISTNVRTIEGQRAIGTRIATDVGDQVLLKGQQWIERAFVVNDWYITSYEPIKNISGKIIGILYVGILEEKFIDMEKQAVWWLVAITILGVVVALILSFLLAASITNPVRRLVDATNRLAKGDFNQAIKTNPAKRDEIGKLGDAFNFMVSSIRERDEKLKQQTQQVVIRSERLAMIGQLAAGVAHEINNPLAGLRTYVKLIEKEINEAPIPGGQPVPPSGTNRGQPVGSPANRGNFTKYLTLMERETIRCSDVVRNLLNFARQTEPRLQLVDINAVLNEALSFMEHQIIMLDLKVSKNLSPLPQTVADFAQLQQVFMNIILNACEAMSTKGNLTLSTNTGGQDHIVIKIQDSGHGISPEITNRIFEPFFTTKKKGTGLGLSAAYGIITQHKGTIEIQSAVGVGTTFTIRLPIKQTFDTAKTPDS